MEKELSAGMSIPMSKVKVILFMIALILTNFAVMADLAIYIIAYNLFTMFPDNVNVVNYIISGTAIIVALASLIAPLMLKHMTTKTMLIGAGIVFCGATIFGAALVNPYYIAGMRTIAGFTMGFINVAAVTMMAEVFIEDKTRAWAIGLYNTFMPLIGSLISFLTGIFAVNAWQGAFHVYWIGVPMVLMTIIFLPRIRKEDNTANISSETAKVAKKAMGSAYWMTVLEIAFLMLITLMVKYYISVYIGEHQIGSVSFTGTASMICGWGSAASGVLFALIFVKLGRKTVLPAFFGTIIGCAILYFYPSAVSVLIGFVIVSMCYGLTMSYIYVYAASLAPKSQMPRAIGYGTATYAVAGFISTYAVTACMSILHTDMFTDILPIIMVVATLLFIYEVVLPKRFKTSAEPAAVTEVAEEIV